MSRLRFFVLFIVLMALAVSVSSAQGALTVTPPVGPNGTTHIISAAGLSASTQYTLEVIYQPSGAVVFSAPAIADSNGAYQLPITTEQADPAGVYVINLRDTAGIIQTGAFTIEAAPAAQTDGAMTLAPGTVEARLDSTRSSDDYTLNGTAGQIVTLTLRSTDFDAFLVLYGADGLQLRYSDNGLPPTDAQILTFELPANGAYRVSATSRNAAESNGGQRVDGAYSLTLVIARPANEGSIANGETLVGELSVVQQSAQYEFNGVAGDVVTIELRTEAFDPAVGLFTPGGDRLMTDDDGGGGLNARINRFTLPSDGQFLIIVDGFRGFTGERTLQGKYTVSLSIETAGGGTPVVQATSTTAPDVAQATPIPSVAQATPIPALPGGNTLDFGQTVLGELTADSQLGSYKFFGTAGDVITLRLDSANFDPKFRLLGPDGTVLAEDDDSGEGLNALLEGITLPRDGEYVVEVDGFRGPAGDRQLFGGFSVSVNRTEQAVQAAPTAAPTTIPGATDVLAVTPTPVPVIPADAGGGITPGTPISGELTEQTQLAAYTFTGAAGDTVTIDLTSDDFDPLMRLLAPDGSVAAEDDDGGGGIQARISAFVLPVSGTYAIEIDSFRGVDPNRLILGVYTISLTLTPAPVVPTATTPPTTEPTLVPTIEATAAPTSEGTPEPTVDPAQATPEVPPTRAAPTSTPVTAPPNTVQGANAVMPSVDLESLRLLGYGDSTSVVFDGIPGAAENFAFSGVAGDLVSVKVTSAGDVDTALRLFSMSDGVLVAEDDDSGAGFDPELFGISLPADGRYILVLYTLSPSAQSNVSVTLTGSSGGSLERGTVSVTLSDKLSPQSLSFNATAGQTIRLSIASVSQIGGDAVIQVQQSGQVLASNSVGQNLRMSFEFIVPADGRVDVKIIRDLGAYGVIELGIERLP